ncbi:PREDICTED: alpha-protein kinase 1-like [Amphimedon queenslandica]|uniref:Uncharacterized protein n=1 Tax=Amphimedon queenslandica TaxID=400682 RepID=A0AAN0JR50_AMPQE|nr:PREDICTED: alpha-protein kinase 1-like [Amphimedon queenslandica]|eukprot:XP_019859470.1 PREDICTED: alpha-protein kinase 1-like [Amphimedon queenslandica]
MKGLVGNTAQKQPQQQGQHLLPEQQWQQPQHIQVPQQMPHYQVQQQPDPRQILQQPQMPLLQQQQEQQPHYYQQQQYHYHPWQDNTGAYAYARNTGTVFQAAHPHVPENNLCFVCNKRWYHETQCDYFGPHKVHKDCHSCIECKGKHQLKLYYDKFVCAKHINKLTCKYCHKEGYMKCVSEGFFCTSCQETIC